MKPGSHEARTVFFKMMNHWIRGWMGVVALEMLLVGNCAVVAAEMAPEVWTRSVVNTGDTRRLERVIAKAERGEKIVVGVIGGSVTQGAKASTREKNYGSVMASWWRTQFPKSTVELVNAGIGATGSNYGALRADRDLLSKKPDFIVVEYAVNDPDTEASAESYEGLLRQILSQPQHPAVVLLFMMRLDGGNSQEWLSKVGKHYNLPMVSFRDALWPEIQAGRLKWEEIEADQVHPNDRGHALAAECVTRFVQQVRPKASMTSKIESTLPKPMISDRFARVTLREAQELQPVKSEGWALDAATKSWKSTVPGSVIEFEVEGRLVIVMDYRIRGPMGRAKVQIDGGPAQTREAWFDQTWGGYRVSSEIARDLAPGKHRVRYELLAEKHAESTGTEFRILGIATADAAATK
ncbi:MAG TPA: SGNH/GDSL hydrolase family protein [Roseimicrobium sp.]|nr:SGNH/GDSL hydrolase family protein [Roseimicrobium sp.]